MRMTQDLKSFGEIIPHTHCSVDEKKILEQNNRKLISLHNNGEDDKHAHGFADF